MITAPAPRAPVWVGLGPTFAGATTASAAVHADGLDYKILKLPAYVDVHGTRLDTGRYALVHEGTRAVLSFVGRAYGVVQNADLARALDPLTATMPVRAAGTTGNGAFVYFVLEGGDFTVAGDRLRAHYLVSDSKGTGKALTIAYAPLHLATGAVLLPGGPDGTTSAALTHKRTVATDLGLQAAVLPRLAGSRGRLNRTFEAMAGRHLTDTDLEAILAAAYPEPRRPAKANLGDELREIGTTDALTLERLDKVGEKHEYYANRACVYRDMARDSFYARGGASAWDAFVVICDVEDSRRGHDSAAESALFGPRALAKQRAFDVAARLAAPMG